MAASWPQNYQVRAREGMFLFGSVPSWTTNNCSAVVTTEMSLSGADTLKVTCTNAGTVQAYKFGISSFTPGRFLTFRFFKANENVNSNVQLLLSNSGANFTNCRYYGANDNACVYGWNYITVDLDNPSLSLPFGYSYTNQGTGFDRLLGVLSIQLQVSNAVVGDVYYVDAVAWGRRARPAVVFGFDDFSATLFANGIPLFDARGITGYLACSPLGNPAQYGTTQRANILSARANGWDIVNHSYAHADMRTLSTADIIADARTNAELLSSFGALTDPRCFVYPQNAVNETVRAALASIGFIYGREIKNWRVYPDESGVGTPLRTGSFALASKTLTEAKAALDDAIRMGTMVNIYSHEIIPGGTGTSPPANPLEWYADDLAALLDYAIFKQRQGLIDIMNFSDWYTGLTHPALVA